MMITHRLLYSWKDPPSSNRILAKSTSLTSATSTRSCSCTSTLNLYFFFFIIKAMPGALGPSSVINCNLYRSVAFCGVATLWQETYSCCLLLGGGPARHRLNQFVCLLFCCCCCYCCGFTSFYHFQLHLYLALYCCYLSSSISALLIFYFSIFNWFSRLLLCATWQPYLEFVMVSSTPTLKSLHA